eukprot:scaffold1496_cov266-Ochromonas_danica.AAC.5
MGGIVSSSKKDAVALAITEEKTEEEVVRFIMPLFYTKLPLTGEEKDAAVHAWKLILNNQCQHFFEIKAEHPEIEFKLVSEYFFDVLYNRMFDVNPSCRGLFHRSINKQGSFLLRMISLLIAEAEDPPKFHSIMGEVLLYTIKKCVGPKEYTPAVHFGWAKIYSLILDVIIPDVVHYEMSHKETFEEMLSKRQTTIAEAATFTHRESRSGEDSLRPSERAEPKSTTASTPTHKETEPATSVTQAEQAVKDKESKEACESMPPAPILQNPPVTSPAPTLKDVCAPAVRTPPGSAGSNCALQQPLSGTGSLGKLPGAEGTGGANSPAVVGYSAGLTYQGSNHSFLQQPLGGSGSNGSFSQQNMTYQGSNQALALYQNGYQNGYQTQNAVAVNKF